MGNSHVVQWFLAEPRFAFVGVSRNPADFSRGLFREFVSRGYDVIPVNPASDSIEGRACYRSVKEIVPQVEAALLMTPPSLTESAVRECAEAGVRIVWMHKGVGPGAVDPKAIELCRTAGIAVVAGECPYMYLPHSGAFHRVHGFFRRLIGHKAA